MVNTFFVVLFILSIAWVSIASVMLDYDLILKC